MASLEACQLADENVVMFFDVTIETAAGATTRSYQRDSTKDGEGKHATSVQD